MDSSSTWNFETQFQINDTRNGSRLGFDTLLRVQCYALAHNLHVEESFEASLHGIVSVLGWKICDF